MSVPFYTIGHSTLSLDAFCTLLNNVKIERVVDIRAIPKSRAHPQFSQEHLTRSLPALGFSYIHLRELGGRRNKSKGIPPAVNGMWHNQSFHNYADYALSEEFNHGLNRLIELGQEKKTVIMCAESLWWRCHRRIVTDYLLANNQQVLHLIGHKIEEAHLTRGALVQPDNTLFYPDEAYSE